MKNKVCLLKKYKRLISYAFWGVCTTVVNVVIYNILYYKLFFSNVNSTIIAWIIAVLFAYATNKLFVFESMSLAIKVIMCELLSFFGCRLVTGVLDLGIMYIAIDCFNESPILWKIVANIVVIIINYILSKFIIFKRGECNS